MGHLLNLLNDANEPKQKRQENDRRQIFVDKTFATRAQRLASSSAH
jgi:hypothetical protein